MRYKVDLKNYMADCEANYYRLKKLLPGFDDADSVQFALPGSDDVLLSIEVIERTPYTSLVAIRQHGVTALAPWIPASSLKVRLYHDARLAEVVNFAGARSPRPRYHYPNEEMLQPDEKAQWNRFLSEWLELAIQRGLAPAICCEFAG